MQKLFKFIADFFDNADEDELLLITMQVLIEAAFNIPANPLRKFKKPIGAFKVELINRGNHGVSVLNLVDELDAYEVTQTIILTHKNSRTLPLTITARVYEGHIKSEICFSKIHISTHGNKDKFGIIDGVFAMLENVERQIVVD